MPAWPLPCPAGTSSILAGTALAALQRAAGREVSREALIHAVLHLEQVLTTGTGLPLRGGREATGTLPSLRDCPGLVAGSHRLRLLPYRSDLR